MEEGVKLLNENPNLFNISINNIKACIHLPIYLLMTNLCTLPKILNIKIDISNVFGAKLKDVFHNCFPCASHRPATFCLFHKSVLILIIAFHASIAYIIATSKSNCQW